MTPHRFNQLFGTDTDFSSIAQKQHQDGKLDVKEDETQYTVFVDLPGFQQDNLDIEVTDENMVHIHA